MIDSVQSMRAPESGTSSAARLKDSARQFEALMIGQMLKSARETGSGWFGSCEDEAADMAVGMAEEQLAQTLAAQGGMGLAKMVSDAVAKEADAGSASNVR